MKSHQDDESIKAVIFDIKRNCSEDGPGIRSTVFFKGCPLRCVWCQNPEGQSIKPDIFFYSQSCDPKTCGRPCIRVCPEKCISLKKTLFIDKSKCNGCQLCVAVCPTEALKKVGYFITLKDLLYKVLIDKPFYDSTGGGVTLSGGEATYQMDFIHLFLRELKKRKIHTVLETAGLFPYESFQEKALPYLDMIYFDLKLMNESMSLKYMGVSNKKILANFERLCGEKSIKLIPRIPLIPEITATEENLGCISAFLREHQVKECSLLPYNPLWYDKMDWLGIKPEYINLKHMSPEDLNRCLKYMKSF